MGMKNNNNLPTVKEESSSFFSFFFGWCVCVYKVSQLSVLGYNRFSFQKIKETIGGGERKSTGHIQ